MTDRMSYKKMLKKFVLSVLYKNKTLRDVEVTATLPFVVFDKNKITSWKNLTVNIQEKWKLHPR